MVFEWWLLASPTFGIYIFIGSPVSGSPTILMWWPTIIVGHPICYHKFLELVANKKAFFGCKNWPLVFVASYSGLFFLSFLYKSFVNTPPPKEILVDFMLEKNSKIFPNF
jgi:hypothetical protein